MNATGERIFYMVLARFKEPSTWRGVVMLATAVGVSLTPEQQNIVISIGVGLSGVIGMVTRDK